MYRLVAMHWLVAGGITLIEPRSLFSARRT